MTIWLALLAAQAAPGATLIDRTRADRASPALRPKVGTPAAVAEPVAVDAPTVTITRIRFTGRDAPVPVARAARPFVGRKASRQTLGELAAALAEGYRHSAVALYTIAIPAQDFADGVVAVRLVEGRVAAVDFGAPAGPLLRARLTPLTTQTPLTQARLERQLTLARAIPGLTLTTDLADPDHDGALRLTATPVQQDHRLTAGFSSRGVELLGGGQLDLAAEGYGVLADGDLLSAKLSAAPDLKRYRLAQAGYVVPVGASGLALSANGAYLQTRPRRSVGAGTAKQVALAASYPLIRSFTRAADVSLSVDGIDSDDATIANVIASERTRAARLAAGYSVASDRRSLALSVAASRGLAILGARALAANPRFTKLTASAAFNQAIGRRGFVRLSASAQYTRDPLPAAERFAIGGEALGRGFDEAVVSGDRGGGGLGEVAWRPLAKGRFGESELYLFADEARVRVLSRAGGAGAAYSLGSAGAGVRARYAGKAELGLEAAAVVDRPYAGYDRDWQVTASWRLTL